MFQSFMVYAQKFTEVIEIVATLMAKVIKKFIFWSNLMLD